MASDLKKFVTAVATEVAETQPALNDLFNFMAIDTSFGVTLDGIGDIVGEDRQGRTDGDFRIAIKTRIFLNASSGEPDTLIRAVRELTVATSVQYNENYPAFVELISNGTVFTTEMVEQLDLLAAGGVKLVLIVTPNIANVFTFADEDGVPNLAGLGYSEVDASQVIIEEEGQFAEVL